MHLGTRLPALALAALTTLVLAACGEEERAPTAAAPAASSAFPATLKHKFGATTIEEAPARVVTVGYTDQDPVLALGVRPVGVGDFLGGYDWRKRPWAQKALGGVSPDVVATEQINFEAVAAKRPDLILAINAGLKKGDYDRLSRIAPTVAQSGDYIDFGMPWDEQTLLVGRALGREPQARRAVQALKAKFARVREEHPEFAGRSALLAYGGPTGYGAYAAQDTRSRFLADLGFKTPPEVDRLAGEAFYVKFSQEQFRLMDQDAVLMYGTRKDVLADPVFRRLDAVREDRVVYLDTTDQVAGALGFASVLSLDYLLSETVDRFSAAVDGDRATAVEQPD